MVRSVKLMDERNWVNVKEIFLSALDKDESLRSEFLDEICNGSPDLRYEIDSLLAAHIDVDDFIEEPAFEIGEVFTNGSDHKEKHFGNYKIIREIGVGGMGAVFLAERDDGEFSQLVAIKIIRQAIADTEIIKRFKRERQILANLNHPNIAKLLDGGVSADGAPFLAMEFVEGEAITKFAASGKLNLKARLKLFLKVCAAVAYAHRNLTVHRDIKPSNILVTKDGEPKLLDFGLAKLLDENLLNDAEQTQTAFRALTPAYASPEQLKNEPITTASDIYSLGVVFYELLTGERPFHFEGKSLEEIIKTITDFEPPLPSANPKSEFRNTKLQGDLDNITLMALRKEPERRYKSVEAFADDIERYLKGLPVSARPNTFKYRSSKFIKRHKVGVLAAILILFSLIGGIVTTAWQAQRADEQRIKAEKRFSDVRKLANSNLFEIHPKIENLAGATEARDLLLKRALEYLDSLSAEAGDDTELQRELAAAYEKVGDVQGRFNQPSLGDTDAALTNYRKAQVLRESLLANDSENVERRVELANNYQQIAFLLWWSSDTKGSVELYEKSLAILEILTAENPNSFELRAKLANIKMLYGDIPAWDGETEKALSLYGAASEILQKLNAEQPDNLTVKSDLARSYSRLADADKSGGNLDKAATEAALAIKNYESLIAAEPDNFKSKRGLWIAYFRKCEIHIIEEDRANAATVCLKLEPLAETLIAADPKEIIGQHESAISHYYTGEVFRLENKSGQALAEYEKSLRIVSEIAEKAADKSEFERNMALNYIAIGKVERQLKKLDAAFEHQQKAQDLLKKMLDTDPDNPVPSLNLAQSYRETGEIYSLRKDKLNAEYNFKFALEIMQRLNEKKTLNTIDKKQINELQTKLMK